jgi:hypothetical protein
MNPEFSRPKDPEILMILLEKRVSDVIDVLIDLYEICPFNHSFENFVELFVNDSRNAIVEKKKRKLGLWTKQ